MWLQTSAPTCPGTARARPALSRGAQQPPAPTAKGGMRSRDWRRAQSRSQVVLTPCLEEGGFSSVSSPRTGSRKEQAAALRRVGPVQVHVCPALWVIPQRGVHCILQLFNNKLPLLLKALALLPKRWYSAPSLCLPAAAAPCRDPRREGHLPGPTRPPRRNQTKLARVSEQ